MDDWWKDCVDRCYRCNRIPELTKDDEGYVLRCHGHYCINVVVHKDTIDGAVTRWNIEQRRLKSE